MKKLFTTLLIITLVISIMGCNDISTSNDITPFNNTTPFKDNVTPTPELAVCYTPTPTATATPYVTATPFDKNNYKMLYVIGSDVNVRSKPSTSGELLYQFSLNQQVKAFFEKDGWYYVEYRENHYGYMSAKYLSETPSPIATPVPTMSRDMALNYDYRLIPTHLVNDEATTTYEMIESENGRILVYEAKMSQITQKIKNKDTEIGAIVDSLLAKWISFMPNSTRTYMSLVEEFEPNQGTLFQVTRISVMADDYKEILDFLENVYLMMIGYEEYKDLNAEKTIGSKDEYENDYRNIYGNIERLGAETIREALQNANGYAIQSQKVSDWYSLWDHELGEFFELKWKILEKLDFSKNTKSFVNYKAYDKYEIYNSYNNQFKDILLIMRGEKNYLEG